MVCCVIAPPTIQLCIAVSYLWSNMVCGFILWYQSGLMSKSHLGIHEIRMSHRPATVLHLVRLDPGINGPLDLVTLHWVNPLATIKARYSLATSHKLPGGLFTLTHTGPSQLTR